MDPTAKTPSLQHHFNRRVFLIALASTILLLIILIPIFISNFTKKQAPFEPDTPKPVRSWEIVFVNSDQGLTVKNVRIKDAVSVKSPYKFSPYTVTVLDKTGQSIYEDNIDINERLHVDLNITPQGSPSAELPIESVITLPYFDSAEKIRINKESIPILELTPPKKISLNLTQTVQAANASCKPLNLVFISDGYSDMAKFHQHVDNFKQLYSNTAPYNSKNIFSFKTIDNPISNSLSCIVGGRLSIECLYSVASIANMVSSTFPELPTSSVYTKVVILADALPTTTGTLGAALRNTSGGAQIAVFGTRNFSDQVALHEVEGHAIGLLNDRYVSSDPTYALPIRSRNNCTDNPQGEQLWKTLGYNSSFPGCTNKSWYAPNDPTGCVTNNPALLKTGPTTSAMSAGGCGQSVFGQIEQEWIRTQILPQYSDVACLVAPSPSPSPSPSISPSPSSSPSPSPSSSPIISPSPSASPSISPSPSVGTPSNTSQPTPGNGGVPGAENVPPGYYSDNPQEDSPVPFTCRPATTTNSAGQQIQLGYLICNPK